MSERVRVVSCAARCGAAYQDICAIVKGGGRWRRKEWNGTEKKGKAVLRRVGVFSASMLAVNSANFARFCTSFSIGVIGGDGSAMAFCVAPSSFPNADAVKESTKLALSSSSESREAIVLHRR